MNIKQYLDSTYLKTPADAGISINEDTEIVKNCIQEAVNEQFKLVMIRPNHIQLARKMIDDVASNVLIGTVIDFPNGNSSIEKKLAEAQIAIRNGVDELDFVINHKAFKENNLKLVEEEIFECTNFCLQNNKVIKWIIEIAALTDVEICSISKIIKEIVIHNFEEKHWQNVFVKSSTGFYKTEGNLPNGATIPALKIMIENAKPLPIKAAGGIKNYDNVVQMINLGVKRIGTSNALNICKNNAITNGY